MAWRAISILLLVVLAGCVTAQQQNPSASSKSTEDWLSSKDVPVWAATHVADPAEAVIVIFSHGTSRPQNRSVCTARHNQPPETLVRAAAAVNASIFRLCSRATDGNVPGSYIQKRVAEISATLDEFLALGVRPENIFLAGKSAGGWASLMSAKEEGDKFNAGIYYAPSCCGRRSEINRFPIWRREIRPEQVRQILTAEEIRALVIAYEDDAFNRPEELTFLTDAYPGGVSMVGYSCGKGHATDMHDCRAEDTETVISGYLAERLGRAPPAAGS